MFASDVIPTLAKACGGLVEHEELGIGVQPRAAAPARGAGWKETIADRGREVREPQSSPRPAISSREAHCAKGRMLI